MRGVKHAKRVLLSFLKSLFSGLLFLPGFFRLVNRFPGIERTERSRCSTCYPCMSSQRGTAPVDSYGHGQETGLGLAVAVGSGLSVWISATSAKRACISVLEGVCERVGNGNGESLLPLIVVPALIARRADVEKSQFLVKALRGEITVEGAKALRARGQFGPLTKVFPEEAAE